MSGGYFPSGGQHQICSVVVYWYVHLHSHAHCSPTCLINTVKQQSPPGQQKMSNSLSVKCNQGGLGLYTWDCVKYKKVTSVQNDDVGSFEKTRGCSLRRVEDPGFSTMQNQVPPSFELQMWKLLSPIFTYFPRFCMNFFKRDKFATGFECRNDQPPLPFFAGIQLAPLQSLWEYS